MSDKLLRESAKLYYFPIVLGRGRSAFATCAKIFFSSGIIPTLCDTSFSLAAALFPFCKSVTLSKTDNPRLICEQLSVLASYEPYVLPILIPTNDKYRDAVMSECDFLERIFIIAGGQDILECKAVQDMFKIGSK